MEFKMKKTNDEIDRVKTEIRRLAKSIASGRWGQWECSLGGLVALTELVSRLQGELGEDFWSEIHALKSGYRDKLYALGVGHGSPDDFFDR